MAVGIKTRRGESQGTAKTYIYNRGAENVALGGGIDKWTLAGTTGIVKNTDHIILSIPGGSNAGGLCTFSKFDWTPYTTLHVVYKLAAPAGKAFGAFSSLHYSTGIAQVSLSLSATEITSQLDVSSVNGQYYLSSYFNGDSGAVTFTVYEIWLV